MVWLPLKCTWMPYLPHAGLTLLEMPLVYGMTIWPIVGKRWVLAACRLVVVLFFLFLFFFKAF